MPDPNSIVLIVLAAAWAAVYNVMQIIKMKNEIRNKVLDMDEGKTLTKDKKELLISHDYIPLAFGICIFLLVFVGGFAAIPFIHWEKAPDKFSRYESWVCFGAAGATAFAMFVDFVASISEYRQMRRYIDGR